MSCGGADARVRADVHPPGGGFHKTAVAPLVAAAGADAAVDLRHTAGVGEARNERYRATLADGIARGISLDTAGVAQAGRGLESDPAAVSRQTRRIQRAAV